MNWMIESDALARSHRIMKYNKLDNAPSIND
jgi:hypothetical protein